MKPCREEALPDATIMRSWCSFHRPLLRHPHRHLRSCLDHGAGDEGHEAHQKQHAQQIESFVRRDPLRRNHENYDGAIDCAKIQKSLLLI